MGPRACEFISKCVKFPKLLVLVVVLVLLVLLLNSWGGQTPEGPI